MSQSTGKIRWRKQTNQPVMASHGIIKDKVFFAALDHKGVQKYGNSKQETKYGLHRPYLNATMYYSLVPWMHIFMERHFYWNANLEISDSAAIYMLFMASRDGLLYLFGSEMTPSLYRMIRGLG